MKISTEIDPRNTACWRCPYIRGVVDNGPDGKESAIRPDDPAWAAGLITVAYCFIADLFNISDARETKKYVGKNGPVPQACPKTSDFQNAGIK